MDDLEFIKEDLVRATPDSGGEAIVLAWGDRVEVLGHEGGRTQIEIHGRGPNLIKASVRGRLPTQKKGVLQFAMVDVQQGDGMVIETPAGKKILIDGGDNKLFARYLAARYRGTSKDNPLDIDAIVVTHGDADHFDGLNQLRKSETTSGLAARKRIFIRPKRYFHNGLVKGPSSNSVNTIFGKTVPFRGGKSRAAVGLVDDITKVKASKLNAPFKRWVATLKHWAKRGSIDMRRLAFGDKAELKFLQGEGIFVDVLGPIPVSAKVGSKRRPGLELLRQPGKSVLLPLDEDGEEASDRAHSASHTINGHSVSLRLRYGNVRFMLSGDHNQESMERLRREVKKSDLQSEILKVPHHGSGDFDLGLLKRISPVVSLISSGDESTRKEHIHPRANLIGALGQVARGKVSLILCTELAAFFAMRGMAKTLEGGKTFFGFERTQFGIIHIRTDGERVLVFTHSGKSNMKEAYRFTVNAEHEVKFAKDVKKR